MYPVAYIFDPGPDFDVGSLREELGEEGLVDIGFDDKMKQDVMTVRFRANGDTAGEALDAGMKRLRDWAKAEGVELGSWLESSVEAN
jgi:flagellar hook-length control protein FliK